MAFTRIPGLALPHEANPRTTRPQEFELKRLGEWTNEDIEDLKTRWRGDGFADATVVKHLNTIRGLFTHATESPKKSGITANPCLNVKWPKVLDSKPHLFFERDQLARIYKASREDKHHPLKPQFCRWHAPAWKFLANTGTRRKEASQLRKAWLRRDVLQILSTSEERTKSGKWREIPLMPGAKEALRELDAILGEDREFILPRMTLPSMSRAAAKCIARAELCGGIHTYRHTFISHLAMDPNVPIRTIQQWAGHSSIQTTELYMYLRDKGRPVELTL
jgi:integrase